jgi:mannose-6-phosphate isomerase-like protein (cupin superfamily)
MTTNTKKDETESLPSWWQRKKEKAPGSYSSSPSSSFSKDDDDDGDGGGDSDAISSGSEDASKTPSSDASRSPRSESPNPPEKEATLEAFRLKDMAMANEDFRRVVSTTERQQLVLMAFDARNMSWKAYPESDLALTVEDGHVQITVHARGGEEVLSLVRGDLAMIPAGTPFKMEGRQARNKLSCLFSLPAYPENYVLTSADDDGLPFDEKQQSVGGSVKETMHEFKHHQLHSGSKTGPLVTSEKQAIAIAMSQAGKSRRQRQGSKHKK